MTVVSHYSAVTKTACGLGTFILVVGVGLHILSLATSYYFVLSDSAVKDVHKIKPPPPQWQNYTFGIHYGLWEICLHAGNESDPEQCYTIRDNATKVNGEWVLEPDWLVAPRVLSILGVLVAASGVASIVAFRWTEMSRCTNLLLVSAAGASIVGGILILAADIAFAAEKTIAFYYNAPLESSFFTNRTPQLVAYMTLLYDNRFASGWSFIIDLISGSLCVVAGPCFVYTACRLQGAVIIRPPADSSVHLYPDKISEVRL